MKHIFEQKVFYSDTDAYGVVWQGSYLRWLEMGRVGVCEMLGHNLIDLKEKNIVLPVVNLNVKYKMSAKLNDVVVTETEISEFNGFTVKFKQIIRSKETGKVCIDAEVSVVAIDNNGKLYRKMPEVLAKSFDEVLKCKELV